jgi:type I site-specific restriction endonuclease
MAELKTHLPHESLARIESGEAPTARAHFVTYPSMMQVYDRISVGHYDLIIADESHRSIYQRYKARPFRRTGAGPDRHAYRPYRPQHLSALRLR